VNPAWRPDSAVWQSIKSKIGYDTVFFTAVSKEAKPKISSARISFNFSKDSVGADIFYRSVTLPFSHAVKNLNELEWYIGSVSGGKPKKMLDNMPVCANCHSFNADGSKLAMDVDYGNDKGSYAVTSTMDTAFLTPEKIISWSDYKREESEPTFGLLSQVSPDGKYVLSTIKDLSVFVAVDNNLKYSQLFFPVKGIIGIYNFETKSFSELNGANDRKLVQSNPSWSPNGKEIIFARTDAYVSNRVKKYGKALMSTKDIEEFLSGGKQFKFDLYKIDFNDGKGAKPVPIEGASSDNMSNYFAKYSPDGKWVVFCKAKNFMLLQPDSKLYIMPANGGKPRLMNCNLDSMNSWHSWSPNSKWLVFSSKHRGLYTQLYLTHIDENGNDSPPVYLENLIFPNRAANIPEFFPGKSKDFKRIKDAFSKTAPSFVAISYDNILNKYYKKAWDNLHNALQIDSNLIDAYFTRITLNAQLFQSNSQIDRADRNRVLQLIKQPGSKSYKELEIIRVSMLAIMGKGNEAIKGTLDLVNKYPNDYKIYDLLASEYRNTKQNEKAFPYYEKMLKLSPDNAFQIQSYYIMDYSSLGKFDKALQIVNQLISENPYSYDLYSVRANIYVASGKFEEAKKDCEVLLSKDAENYKYYELLAQVFTKLGNHPMAEKNYMKAIEILNAEYNKNPENILFLFEKAEINHILGNMPDAIADYDKILSVFPSNYKALLEKARFSLMQNQWDNAIIYYNELLQNYPPVEEFYNNLAIVYLNLKKYDSALEKLNQAIELNPVNCDALYNRSKLYSMSNENKKSEQDLAKIISILNDKKSKNTISKSEREWLIELSNKK
jgi:tetratricopeptide (TPR) repeat protein